MILYWLCGWVWPKEIKIKWLCLNFTTWGRREDQLPKAKSLKCNHWQSISPPSSKKIKETSSINKWNSLLKNLIHAHLQMSSNLPHVLSPQHRSEIPKCPLSRDKFILAMTGIDRLAKRRIKMPFSSVIFSMKHGVEEMPRRSSRINKRWRGKTQGRKPSRWGKYNSNPS